MKRTLIMVILIICTGSFFAMERPHAIGQPRNLPIAGQAIKDCCCDCGYLSKCAVVGGLLCKSCTRYMNLSEIITKNVNVPAAYKTIHSDTAGLIGFEILLLAAVNAHYFAKHSKSKEKTE